MATPGRTRTRSLPHDALSVRPNLDDWRVLYLLSYRSCLAPYRGIEPGASRLEGAGRYPSVGLALPDPFRGLQQFAEVGGIRSAIIPTRLHGQDGGRGDDLNVTLACATRLWASSAIRGLSLRVADIGVEPIRHDSYEESPLARSICVG